MTGSPMMPEAAGPLTCEELADECETTDVPPVDDLEEPTVIGGPVPRSPAKVNTSMLRAARVAMEETSHALVLVKRQQETLRLGGSYVAAAALEPTIHALRRAFSEATCVAAKAAGMQQ